MSEIDRINHVAIDRFTAAHTAAGVIAGIAGVPFWATALGAVAWEIAERPLKQFIPRAFPHPSQDSAANSIVDALAVCAGWAAARFVLQITER